MKEKENERNQRIAKQNKLRGTWELMSVCKDFLQEWEGDWVEGSEEAKERQELGRQELEKQERFKLIEFKKGKSGRNCYRLR